MHLGEGRQWGDASLWVLSQKERNSMVRDLGVRPSHSRCPGLLQDIGQSDWCSLVTLAELIIRRLFSQAWSWMECCWGCRRQSPHQNLSALLLLGGPSQALRHHKFTDLDRVQCSSLSVSILLALLCPSLPGPCWCWWQTEGDSEKQREQ